MSVYPKGIATNLTKTSFSKEKIKKLKNTLPKNLIIRVYGLAGVGKGTLSQMLSETLDIPNLESSLILRCATYIYEKLQLDLTNLNTDKVFNEMDIYVVDGKLKFGLDGEEIKKDKLKNPFIDAHVTKYSTDLYVRQKFDEALDDLVQRVLDSACVADGRGSHEPYLVNAENHGFRVIRILVDTDRKIKAERYYDNYLKNKKKEDPNYQDTNQEKKQILEEFKETIIARDEKDIKNIKEKGIGLISKDSGFIDSSYMTPQEVLETALNFIEQQINFILK